MKTYKYLSIGFLIVLFSLVAVHESAYAKITSEDNDAIRSGKMTYALPGNDNLAPLKHAYYRGDDAVPSGKRFQIPQITEFFHRLIEASYIGFDDFRDYIRIIDKPGYTPNRNCIHVVDKTIYVE